MHNTEIIYRNQTLYINLMGKYSNKNINNLKKRLYSILNQYNINDIIIDKTQITSINSDIFYDMLDDYDIKYGGNLIVNE